MIDIPENIKKNLPKDFSIGKIDLREAETIANEDMLTLTEEELIEGLEDLELIPLKKAGETGRRASDRTVEETARVPDDAEAAVKTAGAHDEGASAGIPEEKETRHSASPLEFETERGGGPGWMPIHELDLHDQGKKWVPIHELDLHDQGKKWVPLHELDLDTAGGSPASREKIPDEERDVSYEKRAKIAETAPVTGSSAAAGEGDRGAVTDTPPRGEDSRSLREADIASPARQDIETREGPPVAAPSEGQDEEDIESDADRPVMVEGYNESDDEYVIWDKSGVEIEPPAAVAGTDGSDSTEKAADISADNGVAVGAVVAPDSAGAAQIANEPGVARHPGLAGDSVTAGHQGGPEAPEAAVYPGMDTQKLQMIFADDRWRGESMNLEISTGQVHFIDDDPVMPDTAGAAMFDESMLDKIIGGMIQIDEGKSYMLAEARIEEDRERVAVLSEGYEPAFEELFVDLDYKYSDEELDYIHAAIVEEDYSEYIREIDEFFGGRGSRSVSASVELLGLTADEFDTVEDILFKEEFHDIHRYERYHLYEFVKLDGSAAAGRRLCRYLLSHEESLQETERDSIESDVSSGSALIFEESVEDIRRQLLERTGKKVSNIVEIREMPRPTPAEAGEAGDEGAPPEETVIDITDRVVILDDQDDVDRFVSGFPRKKQVNIKILLKYLDGLFEKLPESVIKKFANSEYFDLYLKVLNELGV